MKERIAKVQEYIRNSPGNSGGAKEIIDYYKTTLSI